MSKAHVVALLLIIASAWLNGYAFATLDSHNEDVPFGCFCASVFLALAAVITFLNT